MSAIYSSTILHSEDRDDRSVKDTLYRLKAHFKIVQMSKLCEMLGSKYIWAPFKVFNVDMDKDPIQTTKDPFAHFFEIAEKVITVSIVLKS